jgi:hypothetical protein
MKLLRHDLHSLTGAYALDAIEGGAERDRFNRHLSRCQSCAAEVRGFREVATTMAFAAAAEPPPGLRAQVLTAAARTRQLPPEVRTHARPKRTPASLPWLPWLSGAVAMAGIAVAVFFGLAQAHTQSQLNQLKQQDQALALVLSSPQVKVLSHQVIKGGTATVVLAASRHELAVATSGLPALPAGKVYQLWLIHGTQAVSAGLLPAEVSGQTRAVLATGVASGDALGLTVEPAPGAKAPTKPILLALPL